MKFEVRSEELIVALKKAAMIKAEEYQMVLSTDILMGEEEYLCTITACDGNAQVSAAFLAKINMEEEDTEKDTENNHQKYVVIVGTDFAAICFTMADLKKPYHFKVDDTSVEIKCGTAHTTVALKEGGKNLVPQRADDTICVTVDSKNLKKAILKGGYSSAKDTSRNLKNILGFTLLLSDEHDMKLKCYTTDMYTTAGCTVPVETSDRTCEESISYGLACDKMIGFAGYLMAEETEIFLNESQVVFRNGNDFYVFRAYEQKYPEIVEKIMDENEFVCSAIVPLRDMEIAVSLAILTNKEDKPIILRKEKNKVIITDIFKNSVTEIEAEITGDFDEIAFRADFMKAVLAKTDGEKVRLGLNDKKQPIYVIGEDDHTVAIVAPVSVDKKDK